MTTQPEIQPHEPAAAQAEAQIKPHFPWRLFWLLAVMMVLATLLLLPYATTLASIGTPEVAGNVPLLVLSSILQTVLLYWPLALLGLVFSRRLELGAPYLAAIAEGRPLPAGFRRGLGWAAGVGFGLGAIVLVLAGLFQRVLPAEMTEISPAALPNALEGFMASIAAGINEEILLRLFLLSLIAWVVQFVALRRSKGRPNLTILWVANLLAAVIFGLLHLPNLSMIGVPVTLGIVAYVIVLNGLAGLGFGWLYWTYGLESAMLAHFFTDIVLHVITVPFTQAAGILLK